MPDLKISQLPVASATTGAELFPVVQGGVTKQIALNAVRHIGSAVFDANGSMAVDTNTLFVDAVNNRVGIGTASPGQVLDIVSAAEGIVRIRGGGGTNQGGAFFVSNSAGSGTLAAFGDSARMLGGTPDAGVTVFAGNVPLSFYVNSATRATIDTSGNLGLGVTPSAWGGSLVGALEFTGKASLASHASANAMYLSENAFWNGSGWRYIATDFAAQYQQFQGQHQWFTAPSGTAGNAISFTQAMTLDASGNLLVGDPSVTGAVISAYSAANGIIRIRGGSGTNQGGAFFVANSAGSQTLAAFGDSARMLGGSVDASVTVFAGNVPLTFYVNSVERGRYKTTGQLRFVPLSADPGGAETGDVYYNSSTNKLRVYNGAWVDLH